MQVTRDLRDYRVFPRDGYVLPSKLQAHVELEDGAQVDVDVEIVEGKARARRVCVAAEGRSGIGWTTLATVPTRDIVATAVVQSLMTAIPGDDGGIRMTPVDPEIVDLDEVQQVVDAVVRYRPDLERFEGVVVGAETPSGRASRRE